MADKVLRMTRRFDTPPAKVFDAWTDSRLTRLRLFTSIQSDANVTKIDVRVGGKWKMSDTRGGPAHSALGEYIEVDRPRRPIGRYATSLRFPGYADDHSSLCGALAGTISYDPA